MDSVQKGSVGSWGLVPDGSTFELSVRAASDSDEFAANARVVPARSPEEVWEDSDIHPGPRPRELQAAEEAYGIRVAVAFDSDEDIEVAIEARVLAPGGAIHGDPYQHVIRGQRGDIERATLVIFMA